MPEQTEATMLATWDAHSATWRTPDSLLCGHSALFSETWPSWGMTRGGAAFVLPLPGRHTDGSACSSSQVPTLGTRRAQGRDLDYRERHRGQLEGQIASLLPTPRSQNGEPRNQNVWARPLDEPQNLENALARISAPTPPPSTDGNTS